MSNEEKKDDKASSVQIVDLAGSDEAKKLETELVFTVSWTNPETGVQLTGTFTARRPDLDMIAQIGVLHARYCGGERVTSDISFVNEMRAYCEVTLTDVPKWWTPGKFYDATPLRKVWDHVRSWSDSFRNRGVGGRHGAAANDSGTATAK